MKAAGLDRAPRRRFGTKVQWIVTLDTGRFGDWIIVEVDEHVTEEQVIKSLTRAQRRKVASCKLVHRFQVAS